MSDVVCDLDGVIYRGETVLAGVPEALESLAEADVDVLFVTNNSSASTIKVAEKIERLTGHGITEDQVINSAQAGASVLTSSDAPTLVVGEEGIHEALAHRGIETTISPDEANSVVVGICRTFTYDLLSDAVRAMSES